MPGVKFIGDYVIKRRSYHSISPDYSEDDYLEDSLFRLPAYGWCWNSPRFSPDSFDGDYDSLNGVDFGGHRIRDSTGSRSTGSNVSRIGHPRARFVVGRRAERFRTSR